MMAKSLLRSALWAFKVFFLKSKSRLHNHRSITFNKTLPSCSKANIRLIVVVDLQHLKCVSCKLQFYTPLEGENSIPSFFIIVLLSICYTAQIRPSRYIATFSILVSASANWLFVPRTWVSSFFSPSRKGEARPHVTFIIILESLLQFFSCTQGAFRKKKS